MLSPIFPHHQNEKRSQQRWWWWWWVPIHLRSTVHGNSAKAYFFTNCSALLKNFLYIIICIASEPLPTQFDIQHIVCIDENEPFNVHSNRPSQFLDSSTIRIPFFFYSHMHTCIEPDANLLHTYLRLLILMSNGAFNSFTFWFTTIKWFFV